MSGKNILYVCSEVVPYLPETEVSQTSLDVAKSLNSTNAQVRIFMPRYGIINERRYQLHEVIRLSGMNLVVNDVDVPLVIKVASIPKERIQVYFIDNDEYFKRSSVFAEKDGSLYPDNDERCIFFAKGVVETIKKLNWSPDIIHVQGWLGALLPLYLRTFYRDEPIFSDTKIITSIFNQEFEGELDASITDKIMFDEIEQEKLHSLNPPTFQNLMKNAIEHSDALITIGDNISEEITNFIEQSNKPFLFNPNKENIKEQYKQFYTEI